MHGLTVTGVAGAALSLAGHLPGPPRRWAAHGLALILMAAMALGVASGALLLAGAAVLVVACCWSAPASAPTAAVDLAVMAASTAAVALNPHTMHAMPGMPVSPGLFLLPVSCWATARAAVFLWTRLRTIQDEGNASAPPVRRTWALLAREAGGLAMLVSMAAMVAVAA
jgi:hypothetical protein